MGLEEEEASSSADLVLSLSWQGHLGMPGGVGTPGEPGPPVSKALVVPEHKTHGQVRVWSSEPHKPRWKPNPMVPGCVPGVDPETSPSPCFAHLKQKITVVMIMLIDG